MKCELNIKKSIAVLALLLCPHFAASRLNAQESYKVDEVINPRCDLSEVPQITDPPPTGRIFAALDEDKYARAAIIVYGMPGRARRYADDVKQWLSQTRGINPDRLVTMYGGSSAELRLELWLNPPGAPLPVVDTAEDYNSPTRFDTYTYWSGDYCRSDRIPALTLFAKMLKQRPEWRGFIIVRLHRNKRGISDGDAGWDPDGSISSKQALERAAKDKSYLVKKLGLPSVQIKAIVGDADEWTHAELWLVPPGADPPAFKAQRSTKER